VQAASCWPLPPPGAAVVRRLPPPPQSARAPLAAMQKILEFGTVGCSCLLSSRGALFFLLACLEFGTAAPRGRRPWELAPVGGATLPGGKQVHSAASNGERIRVAGAARPARSSMRELAVGASPSWGEQLYPAASGSTWWRGRRGAPWRASNSRP